MAGTWTTENFFVADEPRWGNGVRHFWPGSKGPPSGLLRPRCSGLAARELAILHLALAAPVGVHVGYLPDPYRLLGVLLARRQSPSRRVERPHPVAAEPGIAKAQAARENLRGRG
jgi:hypothetical protein